MFNRFSLETFSVVRPTMDANVRFLSGLADSDKAHCNGSDGSNRSLFDDRVTVIESRAVNALMTQVRSDSASHTANIRASDRVLNILAEEGLARLPGVESEDITTACGSYTGLSSVPAEDIVAVSIVRSGDILLEAVRRAVPEVAVGKILIQRDESHPDKVPRLFYSKLPANIASKQVLLCDPMLATGGSAITAIQEMVKVGVEEQNILFINVLACDFGLQAVLDAFPSVRIVTLGVDPLLNSHKYIAPGLGDFGDRYYNTPH
jgi:uracil phosphoribosyltransferase